MLFLNLAHETFWLLELAKYKAENLESLVDSVFVCRMGYSRKNPKKWGGGEGGGGWGVEDILFWNTLLNFSFFYFTPWNSRQNKAQIMDISQDFHKISQRPLEIPHYLFLVTLGNSTLLLINPCKFCMLFLWYT